MTFLENFVASNLTALVILITFFILLSLILIFILFFKIKKINHTSRSFFSGKNGNDLEQIILSQQKEIKSRSLEQNIYSRPSRIA